MSSHPLRIGDVASRTGVSVDTIRHYERKGLLHDVVRDGSGYRRYPAGAVDRVRVVRRALAIGFSLDELSRIFRQRAAGHAPCAEVRAMAATKLAELDKRIAAMIAPRGALADTMERWDERLRTTPAGGFAQLLDSLT